MSDAWSVVLGLGDDPEINDFLLSRIMAADLTESVTYRAIYNRGFEIGYQQGYRTGVRLAVACRTVLHVGRQRFGPPTPGRRSGYRGDRRYRPARIPHHPHVRRVVLGRAVELVGPAASHAGRGDQFEPRERGRTGTRSAGTATTLQWASEAKNSAAIGPKSSNS